MLTPIGLTLRSGFQALKIEQRFGSKHRLKHDIHYGYEPGTGKEVKDVRLARIVGQPLHPD